jgi:hypothetical protein
MKKLVQGVAVVALAGLAQLAMAQSNDASAGNEASAGGGQVSGRSDSMEAGTIPAAPPGLPEQGTSGAQGPLRSDTGLASDPSIRDPDPATQNGVWEQLPGNRVVRSNPEARQQQQPQ